MKSRLRRTGVCRCCMECVAQEYVAHEGWGGLVYGVGRVAAEEG